MDAPQQLLSISFPPSSEPFDVSKVAGNASPEIKERISNLHKFLHTFVPAQYKDVAFFGRSIQERFVVTEVSVLEKKDEPSKLEGRVVVELDVNEEMINGGGNIHGGCSAFLVDMCSSLAISTLGLATEGTQYPTVSQAINMIYHSPAAVGDRLRLVNTSMTLGNRAQSARTEIWNVTHSRLVASGTHIKMKPSAPPKANL
ncbi:hypothetical protein FA15DRAFT_669292 [Coprinopsis marcescibilis]|uniref:Thioesterase domain-containing protein n=1 Tax=Coprinopsis marcescibilis TaxID=230819 RepID=A0A5C3KWB0_COPMA|nr:hypothetical protein FA15DRAFT_669292 [Coprinopsis marcescibilis]